MLGAGSPDPAASGTALVGEKMGAAGEQERPLTAVASTAGLFSRWPIDWKDHGLGPMTITITMRSKEEPAFNRVASIRSHS